MRSEGRQPELLGNQSHRGAGPTPLLLRAFLCVCARACMHMCVAALDCLREERCCSRWGSVAGPCACV